MKIFKLSNKNSNFTTEILTESLNIQDKQMEFAGKGNRKPQLDIGIELISLDKKNPRLVPYLSNPENATQNDLIQILLENFDTEALALSMIANGYFDEEPIIVVPNEIQGEFSFSNYNNVEDLTSALSELITAGKINFNVIEGNRRVSTIKLLLDSDLRSRLDIDKYYPKTSDNDIIKDISNIPCIIYEKREDISAYLGVRHIAGLLRWEAYAQASYTAETIENELAKGIVINEAIKNVQRIIGDRSDKLRKQYISYKLFLQAKDDLDFDIKPIINKFSLLTVAYNTAAIREYIGVEQYSKVNFDLPIVPSTFLDKFQNVLTWIFGNPKTGEPPVLSDSRVITSTLSHIVKSDDALEYLLKFKDIDGAFERTNGEKDFLLKKLINATKAIQTSLGFAYKHKNDELLLKQVDELQELIDALKKNLL